MNFYTNCTLDHGIHQTIVPYVYIFVFVVGLPTNLLSLYYSFLQIKQKNELGIYLCNLTISDLLYLASLPLWVHYMLQHDDWVLAPILCKICGVLLYENIYITIGFLCCISVNRFLAVVYPLHFKSLHTMRGAMAVSLLIWLKEIVVYSVFLRSRALSRDHDNDSLCFEHYPMRSLEKKVNVYRLLIGFLLPFFLLFFCYIKVLQTIQKSPGIRGPSKIRIKRLVFSTIVIFLCCFGPYHVFLMARTIFEVDCEFANEIFDTYHFGLMLTSLNCVADPILYCFVSESTQNRLTRLLTPIRKFSACTTRRNSLELVAPVTQKFALMT
ncbi:ovarian cancer G-protein coupled receptor 1 [Callorhinchus milii]|nr:ovarian cancer G-protein coupled receptor 1 [Callorhinchus milii]|eukprot:gi/632982774/ref/XP_007908321.1/ PREDICTED: ovarian cancer G-protein coupled receptor 1 [Callorhinchus milii]